MSKDSNMRQKAKILSFHPTGEYYFNKGLKAYHQRDLYKSKKYLERGYGLEPHEPMIACQLAIVCTDLGEYSASNAILETIITKLDPYMTECYYFLANNYAHLGMFKEAYKNAKEYLSIDMEGDFVDDAEDLLDLITLEDIETEESLFEQDSLISEQERARELLEAGEFAKAIEVLNDTIENHPDFWFAYNNLALAQFYLGKKQDAFATLYGVLEKNPGNLHALCNLVVFHFYERNQQEVDGLVKSLEKIRPILAEQQYKLGATFALVGRYDLAYMWLKQLQKNGFDGDETFYYWLSTCAYHLGNEYSAKKAWKKVLEFNPNKQGLEPWGELVTNIEGYEHQLAVVLKKLQSEYVEERLFGLFLYKHCMQTDRLVDPSGLEHKDGWNELELDYLQAIMEGNVEQSGSAFMDAAAEELYNHHQPISTAEVGLYILWFSVYLEAWQIGFKLINPKAWAAAVDYVWNSIRNHQITQKNIAEKYGISGSTLQKYIKNVNSLLR
ncbi:tetratricopeptide repeat protein [Bacillus testis]|uniref:tetratricopeptide repeat protein n=1 Tax=Bacillus testis TaxID=1622072 RepID=UPI00067E8D1B|nr:helix-turn-helix domain-containing protein [Bacillus testis]